MKEFRETITVVSWVVAWIVFIVCACRYNMSVSEVERSASQRAVKVSEFTRACASRGGSAFTTTDPWVCIGDSTGTVIQLLPPGVKP